MAFIIFIMSLSFTRARLFTIPKLNIEVRLWAVGAALAIVLVYIALWRPARGYIAQEIVRPPVESFVGVHPDAYQMRPANKSVLVEVFYFETVDEATAAETPPGMLVESDGRFFRTTEYIFGTPWGFYMVFPLLALLFIQNAGGLIRLHLSFHLVAGLLCVGAYIAGFQLNILFMHVYKALTYYVIPGVSFLLVFAGLFQDRLDFGQKNAPSGGKA